MVVREALLRRASWFFLALFLGVLAATSASFAAYAQVLTPERRAELQRQLDELDAQINGLKDNLSQTQSQQVSLERDLQILDDQIQGAKLSIRRRNLVITGLSQSIQDKENTIAHLNTKLSQEYESLAAIMRKTRELDTTPLVIAALSSESLSSFFADIDQFSAIQEKMQESFAEIRTDTKENQEAKAELEVQLEEETHLRQVQQLQQVKLQQQEAEKNRILKETKGQERAYQELIASKQLSATQIRAALFELSGTQAIPFEQALAYAKLAEEKTGIRPAFLLGIIAEESNLGENVGTGSWRIDMHPTRDKPIFEAITHSLGLDPDRVPVSKKPWYGWGGAMGPAQFIPSTWVCYAGYVNSTTGKCGKDANGKTWNGPWIYQPEKDRIGGLTGSRPPSPWNPKDAFMASALYLTDSGAGTQTSRTEFIAAMCYLAGCGNVNNKSLQFYADDVMCLAMRYQESIDILEGTHKADERRGDIYHTQCR